MKRIVTRELTILCCLLSLSALPPAAADRSSKLAEPKPGKPWENSLGMKFVPVPGTEVLFSVWETRVRDFEAFVRATGYKTSDGWRDPGASGQGWTDGFSQTPLHPVAGVSWDDSEAFCRWLTGKERAAGTLSAGQEFRLPTDAEWSLAVGLPAESGATPEEKDRGTSDVYPWGTGFPPPRGSGNYSSEGDGWSGTTDGYSDGVKFTAPAGSYTANPLGIFDLGGSVWEWCSDWFNAERTERVIRGASFVQGARGVLLSSHRGAKPPGTRDFFNLGFRCVVGPVPCPESWVEPVTGTEFRRLPTGTHRIGSPENERDREAQETLHSVELDRCVGLSTTEVTQAQWKAALGEDPSHFADCGSSCPVESVTLHDVERLLARLHELAPADGIRLPTEAEWEIACRAGAETAFSSGDELEPTDANFDRSAPTPARTFPPNAWGFFDLHGNVWEWTADEHCPRPSKRLGEKAP